MDYVKIMEVAAGVLLAQLILKILRATCNNNQKNTNT